MLSPYNAAPFKDFNVFPKTPAKLLTQYLAPKVKANCLLLACGDPLNILYTVFREYHAYSKRDVDITCCDEEPAMLARNVFLYTLMIDNMTKGRQDYTNYYQIFYQHILTTDENINVIRKHTTNLLRFSENLQKWEQCKYGDIVVICNSDSLKAIRQCWEKYHIPERSNAIHREEVAVVTSKYLADESPDFGNLTASFGALAIDSLDHAASEGLFYWTSVNVISTDPEEAEYANPLFLYSAGAASKFAIPRESNPHSGFHLSVSHPKVDLGVDSPYKQFHKIAKDADLKETIALEIMELNGWYDTFKDFVRRSRRGGSQLKIRVFVGDPCAFCFALDQRRTNATYSPLAGYIRPWAGKLIELDGSCYKGQAKAPAPLSFNVVDASDVVDKIGLLNLLVSVIPLLQPSPSTTISTDARFFLWGLKDKRESKLLTKLLCGSVGHVCSLLGVAPISYLTGIATGDQHDIPLTIMNGFSDRIIWKLTLFGDVSANESHAKLSAPVEDLADFLYDLYLEMPHYDRNDDFKIMAARYKATGLTQYHNPQCTRRGFAALLAFLKPRICTDWPALMNRLVGKLEEAKTNISTEIGYFSLQELYLEMHFFGVYTTEPLQQVNQQILQKTGLGVLTCVVFTIRRSNLNAYHQTFMRIKGRLLLAFQLHFVTEGRDVSEDTHHIFSSTTPMFGKLQLRSDQTYEILEDQKGWNGTADLHILAYVPTHLLLYPDGSKRDVNVLVRMMREWSTVLAFQDTNVISGEMGLAKLSDTEHVRLLKRFPQLEVPSPSPVSFCGKNLAFSNESFECSYPNINFQNGTFTTRITFREGIETHDSFENIRVLGTTPCTVLVAFGQCQYRCTFPFPISSEATIRRAKKSGYIEVVVKLSSPSEKGGYFTNPSPVIRKDDEVCNWNLSAVHFGLIPKLNFNAPKMKDWVDRHLMNMFSDRELQNFAAPTGKSDALTEYKKSIYNIFTRLVGSNDRVFRIKASPNATASVVLFVTGLFLDDPGRAILAEAYALVPSLVSRSVRSALDEACQTSHDIVVGTHGVELWKASLPAMVERCRDFEHVSPCKRFSSQTNRILSLEDAFSCGCHTLGIEFMQNKTWRDLSEEVRRVAISSLFAAPFVEDSRSWLLQQFKQTAARIMSNTPTAPRENSTQCRRTGCTNEGLKKCSRCGKANYCSQDCQRAHWKEAHKAECQNKESVARTDSSTSTTRRNPPSNQHSSSTEGSRANREPRIYYDPSPRISRTESGEIRVSRLVSLAELKDLAKRR